MSRAAKKPFRFNFGQDSEDEAKQENKSDIEIVEERNSHPSNSKEKPVWWSKIDAADIPDKEPKPKKLGKFVRPGEAQIDSPEWFEEKKTNKRVKPKCVQDLSARRVELTPSLDSWDKEYCTLFVQFESGLPSNSVIRSLHSGVTHVSRPKWALKRKGCCVEFETPELAAEALNEIEEMEMEGGPVKVDFLYNVTNKETHSKRYSETGMTKNHPNENGVGTEEQEDTETDTNNLDRAPAFEVDYDILKEQGINFNDLIQGFPNGRESLEGKQEEDKEDLIQNPSDRKVEWNHLEVKKDIKAFASSFSSGYEPKPEGTGIKGVEAEDLKVAKENTEIKQGKKKKERQRFSDQKAESQSTAVRSWKKANDLKETSSEQGKKTKGVMQTSEQEETGSTEVRRKKEKKRSVESFPDLSAKTESKKIKKGKKAKGLKGSFTDQKWETKSIESERIEMKRKREDDSTFLAKKMKISENEGNKNLNGDTAERNMKKNKKRKRNWIVKDSSGQ